MRVGSITEGRVTGVHKTPKHVLNPIWSIEDTHDQSLAYAIKGIEEHLPSFVVDLVRLLEKGVFTERAVRQCRRVFGKSQRGKQSLPARQVVRVRGRVGNWHGGRGGIKLDRRAVQFDMWFDLSQIESTDPAELDSRREAKRDACPLAVLANNQLYAL